MYLFFLPFNATLFSSLEGMHFDSQIIDGEAMGQIVMARSGTVQAMILASDDFGPSARVVGASGDGIAVVELHDEDTVKFRVPIMRDKEFYIALPPSSAAAVQEGSNLRLTYVLSNI